MSVPYALSSTGMPIGVQIFAPALAEERLLTFGRVIEANAQQQDFVPNL